MDSLIQQQYMSSISPYWDFHNSGFCNADYSFPFVDSYINPSGLFSSDFESDTSTGYLQDALVKLHDQSKRRRLFFDSDDQTGSNVVHVKSYENSNSNWDLHENMSCLSQLTTTNIDQLSDEPKSTSSVSIISEEEPVFGEEILYSSPDSHHDNSLNQTISSSSMLNSEARDEKRKKRNNVNMMSSRRKVYPFQVVKPGGVDGNVTLNDINERIQMTPTRSIKHPVGDYACRPSVSFANGIGGAGLSGKVVVALTTIHTQGRGTITIIRTKG